MRKEKGFKMANGNGRGWYGDSKRHAFSGQKGGKTTAQKGSNFYKKIGKKGGKTSPGNFKFDPKRAQELGRRGGKARHGLAA